MAAIHPLVSIIIPVYNGAKYIKPCVESVLGQCYPNKEIIIVNDGSTDNSAEVIKSIDGDIKYIYQENAGSAVARNTGIDNALGDFIAFNDGDDLWAPNRLHQQVRFLQEHPEYGVATGKFTHVDDKFELSNAAAVDDGKPVSIISERSGWVYHTLFETSWYHIIAALVRREVLNKVRFNPSYRRGQDYDFWLQLAHHTQIAQLSANYAYYRKNQESISHKPHLRNYRAEIITNALNTMGDASQSGQRASKKELDKVFYKVWFEYGYELLLAGWYRLAIKAFFKTCAIYPTRFDPYKQIFRCLLKMPWDKSPR
ncbi:glycosyltransferase family 2 protein [Thalassotalea montiporae]